ncbi:MAG: PH domain-containing protein [Alphaproteobacteria bacterium]|nr:PH domain-containing protein [Alphaproteobacteria bacterium]
MNHNRPEIALLEGERILAHARIHEAIYWPCAAVFVLALLFALFIARELGVFLAFVAVLLTAYTILKRQILLMVITNKRVLSRVGILQVDVVDMHLDKIESIELERMPLAYALGYANVVITGMGNRIIVVPYVANATEIRQAYNQQVLGNKPQE